MRMFHYHAFGLKLESDIPLPELHRGSGPGDVAITLVPYSDGSINDADARWFDGGGERVTLRLEGIEFVVEGGTSISIAPPPGTQDNDIRVWLLGTVMATLLHQRGYFSLHANAVRLGGGGAAAFSGPSGAGKSTLAGLLDRAGFEVLGDDLCAIRFGADGAPMLYAGIPRLKLWENTLDLFGRGSEGLEKVAHDLEKFHVPVGGRSEEGSLAPARLERLYLLDRKTRDDEPLIVPLSGAVAAGAVLDNTFRWGIGQSVGGEGSRMQFDQALAIARHCAVYRVARTWSEAALFDEGAEIAAHLRNSEADGGAGS